jgi:hypothetical protein
VGVIEPQPAPPRTRVPGILAVRQYVGYAKDAAVTLLEIRAFSQGCLLEFVTAVRGPGPDGGSPRFAIDFGPGATETRRWPVGTAETRRVVSPFQDPVSGAPRLWISPLPPAEGFTLVTDWPEHGIVGVRTPIDGAAVRLAAWESFPCLPA